MYISSDVCVHSFQKLRASSSCGKTYKEKTSCLMYFLAFDILSKKEGLAVIDFLPRSKERRSMELEYCKLVLFPKKDGKLQQVAELGLVDVGSTGPEKKISSNFFTVPLKKASEKDKESDYPNRPSPLLLLGHVSQGVEWGIKLHPNWKENILRFFEDTIDNTPFTDLAIFVCRNDAISMGISSWHEALSDALRKKFTTSVADFWIEKIDGEKLFVRDIDDENFFTKNLQQPTFISNESHEGDLRQIDKNELITYILYLEQLLDMNSIPYNK